MYQKEKQKDIKNEKTDEGEAQLRTKIPDTHYVRVMLKRWECNSCLAKEEKQRKDVNTNLGMMLLPGALVRENTRIKKNTVLAYLYTQKGFVQDLAPPLRTRQSPSTLYFSHGAHKKK